MPPLRAYDIFVVCSFQEVFLAREQVLYPEFLLLKRRRIVEPENLVLHAELAVLILGRNGFTDLANSTRDG